MSKSKLLKEAIADAKAVRETAIANAKIALEEAFTPRLQSILSKRLQAEMEGEDEELEEEYSDGSEAPTSDASDIGDGDNKQPADDANSSSDVAQGNPDTDVETSSTGEEDENVDVVTEEEDEEMHSEGDYGDEEEVSEEDDMDFGDEDEDELDLEAIIRELEGEDHEEIEEESPAHDAVGYDDPTNADDASISEEEDEKSAEIAELKARLAELEGEEEVHEEEDDVIDLDEILREMGYGDDEEEVNEEEEEDHSEKMSEMEDELEEAYKTIKSLRGTINEVNLLNAKLLYTNKLFRGYNLTNEQKVKVVENLDRTTSVREVKLVYATLAESMKFGGSVTKKVKKNITEGLASKPSKSTAPKKEVITENANVLAERFKKLAGLK
jgi:hypothetical protein